MFLKLKIGKQNEIINNAIVKAGSERKLCKIIGIPKGTLYMYKSGLSNIKKETLQKILDFIGLNINYYKTDILKELPDNWGRTKGGINCVKKKKDLGTFEKSIDKLRLISSKRMRMWHNYMKENFPKEYYTTQYERFKKIKGGYTHKLINNIPVRNKLEEYIGNFLISQGINFEYEPYININGKAYFPDFKIKDRIIEVTEWCHPNSDKLIKLKNKIKDYKKRGFDIVFFIPKDIRLFYKEIGCLIISDLKNLIKWLTENI